MAALGFSVASKEVFESVATLLQGPQEALCTQPLCNGPVHLAVLVTGAQLLRERGLTENGQEGLGLLVAPVHTCHSRIKFKDTRCLQPFKGEVQRYKLYVAFIHYKI